MKLKDKISDTVLSIIFKVIMLLLAIAITLGIIFGIISLFRSCFGSEGKEDTYLYTIESEAHTVPVETTTELVLNDGNEQVFG